MNNETDDFETHPSFEKEGGAVGGKRSLSNTWNKGRVHLTLKTTLNDGAIAGKSRAKNICLFRETAALGICPLYVS